MVFPSLHDHYSLLWYYEILRLPVYLLHFLEFYVLSCITSLEYAGSPWLICYPLKIHHWFIPRQHPHLLAFSFMCFRLRLGGQYRLLFYNVTRLIPFTLSHCGSLSPLSTLKPNVTILVPRLEYWLVANLCQMGFFLPTECHIISGAPPQNFGTFKVFLLHKKISSFSLEYLVSILHKHLPKSNKKFIFL